MSNIPKGSIPLASLLINLYLMVRSGDNPPGSKFKHMEPTLKRPCWNWYYNTESMINVSEHYSQGVTITSQSHKQQFCWKWKRNRSNKTMQISVFVIWDSFCHMLRRYFYQRSTTRICKKTFWTQFLCVEHVGLKVTTFFLISGKFLVQFCTICMNFIKLKFMYLAKVEFIGDCLPLSICLEKVNMNLLWQHLSVGFNFFCLLTV